MAIFGAPVAHEDDPERAVRAALAIREWAERRGIEVRIGVNTGEALVTLDARPEAGETMVGGRRRQHGRAAPVGGAGERHPRRRADVPSDGARDRVRAMPSRSRRRARRSRCGLARGSRALADRGRPRPRRALVGRRREVDLLVDALDRVIEERSSQLVTIVGVPGIGKSRLVLELYDAIERQPGADLVAPRPVPALRRGRHVLGARRDGQGPGRHPRGRRRGRGGPEARAPRSPTRGCESHLRPLVGLAGAGGGRRRHAGTRRSPRGAASSRGSPTSGRSCSSSRTCTGPTTT